MAGGPFGFGILPGGTRKVREPFDAVVGHHQQGHLLKAHAEIEDRQEAERLVAALRENRVRGTIAPAGQGKWAVVVAYKHIDQLDNIVQGIE